MAEDVLSSLVLKRRPWLSRQKRLPWLSAQNSYSFGFTRAASEHPDEDREIGERLIAAYRKAIADAPGDRRPGDMWTEIVDAWYGELIALIRNGNPIALTSYLRALPRQLAGHGYFQGRAAFEKLSSDRAAQRRCALWLMDQLAGMAEATGVLPIRCPEQSGWKAFSGGSACELRTAIQTKIGLSITLPPVFDGLFVLEPESGPIHLRTIAAAYAVRQLSGLLQAFDGTAPSALRVAEIGAGVGFTAFTARKLGFARYSIFDIPEVNIAQAYFLLKALSRDDIALYGEDGDGKPVSVLPAFAIHDAPDKSYDAVMNIDSLPEIAKNEAERYLVTASRCARWFFSINQESQAMQTSKERQLRVCDLVQATGSYRPILRVPNWIRAGYVEELWKTIA